MQGQGINPVTYSVLRNGGEHGFIATMDHRAINEKFDQFLESIDTGLPITFGIYTNQRIKSIAIMTMIRWSMSGVIQQYMANPQATLQDPRLYLTMPILILDIVKEWVNFIASTKDDTDLLSINEIINSDLLQDYRVGLKGKLYALLTAAVQLRDSCMPEIRKYFDIILNVRTNPTPQNQEALRTYLIANTQEQEAFKHVPMVLQCMALGVNLVEAFAKEENFTVLGLQMQILKNEVLNPMTLFFVLYNKKMAEQPISAEEYRSLEITNPAEQLSFNGLFELSSRLQTKVLAKVSELNAATPSSPRPK